MWQQCEPLVYYWSATGNTEAVALSLDAETRKITPGAQAEQPYILMAPSYGSPRTKGHTPKAVKDFLKHNHQLMVGVIGVGNIAFGTDYCASAYSISAKFQVPIIYTLDMRGGQHDRDEINRRIQTDWHNFTTQKETA